MKLGKLHWILIGIVTTALVVMAPSDNEDNPAGGKKSGKSSANNAVAPSPLPEKQPPREVGRVELERLAKLEAQQQNKKISGDVFNATSWYVPPPPPPYVPPPPPPPPPVVVPTAPPLPFTYLGRYGDAASRIIILAKGDRIYTVGVGDVIENTYRIEKLAAGTIVLIYLPLNIEQTLSTGDAL